MMQRLPVKRVSKGISTGLFASAATFTKCTAEKITFVILGLFDLALTVLAVNLGFHELNPFIRFLIQIPVLLVLVKFIIPFLMAWLMPGKLLWPSIALLILVVALNVKELIVYFV